MMQRGWFVLKSAACPRGKSTFARACYHSRVGPSLMIGVVIRAITYATLFIGVLLTDSWHHRKRDRNRACGVVHPELRDPRAWNARPVRSAASARDPRALPVCAKSDVLGCKPGARWRSSLLPVCSASRVRRCVSSVDARVRVVIRGTDPSRDVWRGLRRVLPASAPMASDTLNASNGVGTTFENSGEGIGAMPQHPGNRDGRGD